MVKNCKQQQVQSQFLCDNKKDNKYEYKYRQKYNQFVMVEWISQQLQI